MGRKFKNFSEFYPYYLSEHSDPRNRILHFFGCLAVILVILYSVFTQVWLALILVPLVGYGFAWIGHLFIEKNKPATLKYPIYSLLGDWKMFFDIITRKIKFWSIAYFSLLIFNRPRIKLYLENVWSNIILILSIVCNLIYVDKVMKVSAASCSGFTS